MKLEVIVIPVSDVDRAKEFYRRLGWRLDAESAGGDDFRVMQFTPPGSGASVIFGKSVTSAAPGSAQGLYLIVSDIEAAQQDLLRRGVEVSEVFHGDAASTLARTSPTCSGGIGSAVRIPSIAVTARSHRFVIPTATAGCCRKSRLGCQVGSPPRRPPSRPRRTWRARCGGRRPPTRSMRSAPGSAMRTGPIGTPRTWWPSRPGSSCRHEPAAHGAGARRFLVAPQEHPLSLASPQGHLSWSTIRSAPALR
jgi:catechol 2,3-dioxygenase-like lactoylglutathione lyase family enzyme